VIGDANTTYSTVTNGGLRLDGTNFGLISCTTGQVLKSTGTNTWGCAADANTDTNTIYAAGSGLSLAGNTFSLMTCPTGGQLLKWNNLTSGWECAADQIGATMSYFGSDSITINGSTHAISVKVDPCPAASMAASNKYYMMYDVETGKISCGTKQINVSSGLKWVSGDTIIASLTINAPTCAAGEFLTWSGTAFSCATPSGGAAIQTLSLNTTNGTLSISSGNSVNLNKLMLLNPELWTPNTEYIFDSAFTNYLGTTSSLRGYRYVGTVNLNLNYNDTSTLSIPSAPLIAGIVKSGGHVVVYDGSATLAPQLGQEIYDSPSNFFNASLFAFANYQPKLNIHATQNFHNQTMDIDVWWLYRW
jgi:hypothetical protein